MNILIFTALMIFVLWVLNFYICAKPLINDCPDPAFSKKAIENGRNTLTCLCGVAGTAVALWLFPFLRWVILIFYGGAFAFAIVISTIVPIITGVVIGGNDKWSWLCILSNFFQAIADGLVLYGCIRLCFGWL